MFSVSLVALNSTPAVLVEIIVFCTVSIIPLAIYSAFAAVSGAEVKSFVDELVNLQTI